MNLFMSFVIIATIMLVAAQKCHCETRVQARGKMIQTPELWSALGCMITDDDMTKCVRDHTIVSTGRKDKADASDEEVNASSEDNSPGLFDAISAFVNDGIIRFFEDDEKDKKEETDSHNDADDHSDDTTDDYDSDENEGGDDDDDNDDDDDDDDDNDDDDIDDDDDDDSDEDLDDTNNFVNTSNRTTLAAIKRKNKRSVAEAEESRRRKKRRKGDKMMKLMMLGMMLKSKLNTIMMAFGAFMQLKFFALSMLNLLVGLVRLYMDLTKKKEPQKVIYYEQAHHQHVYDQQHEDKGWLGGWLSKNDDDLHHDINGDPQNMAYHAQKSLT